MKELSLEEAALAWAHGKRVEATTAKPPACDWRAVNSIGTMDGWWNANVFGESAKSYSFRLAPEPPAKKFRPWKPEEVPVGALVRLKENVKDIGLIIASAGGGIIFSSYANGLCDYGASKVLDTCEHSLDNGKTWLPCGVEVDA